MKYFIDTEFLEGKQKEKFPISLFRKETPNTIDLISIGIVSEDITKTLMKPADVYSETVSYSRKYYAVSKDFNLKEAWNRFDLVINKHYPLGPEYNKVYWLRENVLKPIFKELYNKSVEDGIFIKNHYGYAGTGFSFRHFEALIKHYGKTNKDIAVEIQEFVYGFAIKGYDENESQKETTKKLIAAFKEDIEFYAYYADYDWVVFCWLFGKMMDLPNGFPMYCRDLKQMMDDKRIPDDKGRLVGLQAMKSNPNYPKQTDEHNALADAKWNKKLYEFLNKK